MEKLMQGDNRLGALWDKCFAENTFAALESQVEHVFDPSYVGFMTDWDLGDGDFSYIVGMMMKDGAQIPDGYIVKKLPACKAGVGWIRGDDVRDVCSNAHEQTTSALKGHGRQCETMRWCMELYNCPRFTTPDENGKITLDYYIPLDA
jgi:predicted transcriptional regulator YdeE